MASAIPDEFGRTTPWDRETPLASAAADPVEWRFAAACIGLPVLAVAAPFAIFLSGWGASGTLHPWLRGALTGALVPAPGALGLAAFLARRRVMFRAREAGAETEQAVLRVFAAAAMLAYALGFAAVSPSFGAVSAVPAAATGLVGGWLLLLWTVLSPSAARLRTYGGAIFDAVVISAFLHFGGAVTAGWYPLYIVAAFYAGGRFGLGVLSAASTTDVIGFAAVALSSPLWRGQPVLAAGLLAALGVLPAVFGRAVCRGGRSGRPAAAQAGPAATTAAPSEAFDLRLLLKQTLTPLQAKAIDRGVVLRWRVDPRLPYRLRGSGDTVAAILRDFAEHATALGQAPHVCISLDPATGDAGRTGIEIRMVGLADGAAAAAPAPLRRLVETAGGLLRVDRSVGRRVPLIASLPLAGAHDEADPTLDLDRRPVVIATEDDSLARDLAEPLATWNGEPRWSAAAADMMAELAKTSRVRRAIVIVDGREHPLSALGLVRQAAQRGADAPFVLLIADPDQLANLAALDEGEIDGFIPAPPTEALVAKALYALPLPWDRRKRDPEKPIGTPLDARAMETLRALDGGAVFLGELIDAFRSDARQFLQCFEQAVAAGDSAQFAQGLTSLRRAAGHLGGTELCNMATSLQRLDAGELRVQGLVHARRLEAEVDRLCDALGAVAASGEPTRH